MEKFETHLHTGNTSYCALVPPENIPELYAKCGYSGIVVTDHYMGYVLDRNGETSFKKKIDNLLYGYRKVKEVGESLGLKIWLGMEINLERYNDTYMPGQEYLVYGSKLEEILYSHPYLNQYTQVELFDLCNENNMLMFQAHPFRSYCSRGQTDFMHGIEVYNGNARHNSENGVAAALAREYKLLKISGGDFHLVGDENKGGILLPEGSKSIDDLTEHLKNGTAKLYIGDE